MTPHGRPPAREQREQTDEGELVRFIGRTSTEEVRVTIKIYEGHKYVDLRLWVYNREERAWFPTKKGLSVRVGELRDVSRGLLEALDVVNGKIADGRGNLPFSEMDN